MKTIITALGIAGLCTLPLSGLAAGYQEISVANGGSISGKVVFNGEDPAPRVYRVTKDNQVCGEGDREIDYVRVNNGALQDVVVYLDKVQEGKPFPPELGDGSTVQEGCEFKPYFSVMRNNAKFESVNKDPVLHNIHTYEILGRRKKTVFNISQPDQNTVTGDVTLKRGVGMKVECDAHDFMHALVFVANNPYFAVVDENGAYSIKDVPPGKYTLKAWHGLLGEEKAQVEVSAGGSITTDFGFSAK
jgi:hypothetical protein